MLVATAGHVDHGKTSLIKQLSGTDTDSLEEERRRGLSINLGYAYLYDSDVSIGFIDVPGHSRFINTMISGVSGIDLALLVIAANEGLMPQTLEHLEVLNLLGIDNYAIVITHIDRVEESQIKSLSSKLRDVLRKEAPVFQVDNLSGSGVDRLKFFLLEEARRQEKKSDGGYFRLSIDRSFLVKGIGLVVTGTVISGSVSEGDKLFLLPKNQEVRVRGIHSQNEKSLSGRIGQRCALQLSGVDKTQIKRGDWLHGNQASGVTNRLNIRLEVSSNLHFKIRHLSPVKLYIGAKLQRARLYLLQRQTDGNEIIAGNHVLAQLIVDDPISCSRGDRFILRDSSECITLGGGVVLDPYALYSPKLCDSTKAYLLAMGSQNIEQVLNKLLVQHQYCLDLAAFNKACNLRDSDLECFLVKTDIINKIKYFSVKDKKYVVLQKTWNKAEQSILDYLERWHRDNPSALGEQIDRIQSRLSGEMDENTFLAIICDLIARKMLIQLDRFVKLEAFEPTSSPENRRIWKLIENALIQYDGQIATLSNLQQELALDDKTVKSTLQKAVADGRVYKLNENRFLLFKQLSFFVHKVAELANNIPLFSVVEVKNNLGLGRNSCIELLEYFDRIGFTRRDGERRRVIDKEMPDRVFNEK